MEFGRRPAGRALCALLLGLLLAGCAYTTGTGLPSGITNVSIPTIGNRTNQYTLSQEVTDALVAKFQGSGQLRLAGSRREATSLLAGTVTEYTNVVFGIGSAQQAQEYEVSLKLELQFKDLGKNRDLWKDVISMSLKYSTQAAAGLPASSEAEARKELVRRVADEVYARTVSRW